MNLTPARSNRLYDALAIVVIVAGGILSCVWVFLVPIFQTLDEPAHFDYAVSMFAERRVIGATDGAAAWIVSPYTRYLMRVSDSQRIAGHSSQRVASDYGTLNYYRALDRSSDSVRSPAPNDPGKINYIANVYPFGYYALEALWMWGVATLTGSLTALFFSARLLNVFLTMAGLYFSYRAALGVGVPQRPALGLLVAVAFFPLTLQGSASIQPDNLAFALVAASLFLATRYRESTAKARTTLWLGLSLGALAITKYHFFACTFIPIAALVVTDMATRFRKPSSGGRLWQVVALIAPSAILLAVQFRFVSHPSLHLTGTPVTDGLVTHVFAPTVTGFVRPLGAIMHQLVTAFSDYFFTGPSSATYWAVLGWVDTPIVIVNVATQHVIRSATVVLSLSVAVGMIYAIFRNAMRIARIARRHLSRAVSAAVSDPVGNSYLCFAAFMLVLYALTNNAFGATGRHWYPYSFAGMMCAVWYVPKQLRHLRARIMNGAAIALALYSLVASAYATADIHARYYGPSEAPYVATLPLRLSSERVPLGYLGPPIRDDHPTTGSVLPVTFATGTPLKIWGSAAFAKPPRPAMRVAALVDGKVPIATIAHEFNFRIAESTQDIPLAYSAFSGSFGTSHLGEGVHVLNAYAQLPTSATFAAIGGRRLFFLTPNGGPFSSRFMVFLRESRAIAGHVTENPCAMNGSYTMVAAPLSAPNANAVAFFMLGSRPFPADADPSYPGTYKVQIPADSVSSGSQIVTAFILSGPQNHIQRLSSVGIARAVPPCD